MLTTFLSYDKAQLLAFLLTWVPQWKCLLGLGDMTRCADSRGPDGSMTGR